MDAAGARGKGGSLAPEHQLDRAEPIRSEPSPRVDLRPRLQLLDRRPVHSGDRTMFLKNRESMRQIGLACFVLAQATHFLIRPASTPARDLVDGIFGLLL